MLRTSANHPSLPADTLISFPEHVLFGQGPLGTPLHFEGVANRRELSVWEGHQAQVRIPCGEEQGGVRWWYVVSLKPRNDWRLGDGEPVSKDKVAERC